MTVTRDSVLRELLGFEMILRSAAILPEPEIPDNERWSTFEGPKFYPYVRTIGGVSLFDFDGFEPEDYGRKYPMSSWSYFVPYRRDWRTSVWVEIDRQLVAGLASAYKIDLTFSPPPAPSSANAPTPTGSDRPSVLTALQEQLGLKLESARGPLPVLVIDNVEQPSPD